MLALLAAPARPFGLWQVSFRNAPAPSVLYTRLVPDGAHRLRAGGTVRAALPGGYRLAAVPRLKVSPSGRFTVVAVARETDLAGTGAFALYDNRVRGLVAVVPSPPVADVVWSPDERAIAVYGGQDGISGGKGMSLALWRGGQARARPVATGVTGALWTGTRLAFRTGAGLRSAAPVGDGWRIRTSSAAEVRAGAPGPVRSLGLAGALRVDLGGTRSVHGARSIYLAEARRLGFRAIGVAPFWPRGAAVESVADALLGTRMATSPPRLRPRPGGRGVHVVLTEGGGMLQTSPTALYYLSARETAEVPDGFLYALAPSGPGRRGSGLRVTATALFGVGGGTIVPIRETGGLAVPAAH